MSKENKARLRSFSDTDLKNSRNNSYIVLTGEDVKRVFKHNDYTWVHYWVPYCRGGSCKPLFYYDKIAAEQPALRYMPVSQEYNLARIDKSVKQADFRRNIYFPSDSAYGHKMFKARAKFTSEIIPDENISKGTPTHMVFKGDKLIYYGIDISAEVMDSVLKHN